FFQAEDGIRDFHVTGVQTCALPIWSITSLWHSLPGVPAASMAVACVAILAAVVVLALGATRPSKNNAKHGHTPGNTCHTCRQAEAALRTRSAFLAAISHDLRTAMNAVVGMLELTLVSGSLGFAEKRQLSTALDASRSL